MVKRALFACVTSIAILLLISACQSDDDRGPTYDCNDPLGCITIAPGAPITIASIQTLSGGTAPIGQAQDRSIRMALADRDNRVLGHLVVVKSVDTACTLEGGANAALRAVADPQLVAVLGTTCSSAASGAMPIVSSAGLVMISGANTAPALTSIDGEQGEEWYPGYFRTIYSGDKLVRAAARFAIEELGIRRAATLDDGDLYSRGVARSFHEAFEQSGGTITLDMTINKGDQDYGPALKAIANSEPELLFAPIFPAEAGFLMAQAGTYLPLETFTFLGTESLLVNEFLQGMDPAIRMYFTTATSFENEAIVALTEHYRTLYQEYPHTGFHYAYDSANLLMAALETAADQETDGTLHIGRQKLRDTLYGTRDFEGISGTLSCDIFGDCNQATFFVVRFDDSASGLAGVLSNIVASYRFE